MRIRFDFEDETYFDIKIIKNENGKLFVKDFLCNNGTFEYMLEEITSKKN